MPFKNMTTHVEGTVVAQPGTPTSAYVGEDEQEAVAAARACIEQVIANCDDEDYGRASPVLRMLDYNWNEKSDRWKGPQTLTAKLWAIYSARYRLLGAGKCKSDTLPRQASEHMQAGLVTIDNLADVLHAHLKESASIPVPV